MAFWGFGILRSGVFRLRISPLRPRLTWVPASPNRFLALQLKPRLKSDSWVPEMCSTEIRAAPCPPRPSGAGNVSTRNRPCDPAARKPSSQDQTWGHKKRKVIKEIGRGGKEGQGVCHCSFGGRGGRSGITAGPLQRGHFLTTASGAGDAKTRHWRRAGPLKKAGAECRAVTIGGAGLEIVDQSDRGPALGNSNSQQAGARSWPSALKPIKQATPLNKLRTSQRLPFAKSGSYRPAPRSTKPAFSRPRPLPFRARPLCRLPVPLLPVF